MASVAELLAEASELPGDEGWRDAQILLSAALQKSRTYLLAWPDADVPPPAAQRYRAWLRRRRRGEPVAYLLGARDFWTLSLAVTPHTLIPRPETELLVEQALALKLPRDARVVDLGTGSGAIALALARERPGWQVTGVDRSPEALAVAKANADTLGLGHVAWLAGNWFEPFPDAKDSAENTAIAALTDTAPFDLIVSNPPYVAEDDPHLTVGDVLHEPRSALVAADGGLADLQCIIEGAPAQLRPGGWLLLEHGFAQGAAVRQLLQTAGFHGVESLRDLAGHERVSVGCYGSY